MYLEWKTRAGTLVPPSYTSPFSPLLARHHVQLCEQLISATRKVGFGHSKKSSKCVERDLNVARFIYILSEHLLHIKLVRDLFLH